MNASVSASARARVWMMLLACVAMLPIDASTVQADVPEPGPGRVIEQGKFSMRYMGFDGGEEHFVLTRNDEGFELRARLRQRDEDKPVTLTTYRLDESRKMLGAELVEETRNGMTVTYRVEGAKVVAEARRGGEVVDTQELAISPGHILTGPNFSKDFFLLHPLNLKVGEKATVPVAAFGFGTWRVQDIPLEVRRERDKTVRSAATGRVKAQVYRTSFKTPTRTVKARTYFDERGVVVKVTVDMSIGAAEAKLEDV